VWVCVCVGVGGWVCVGVFFLRFCRRKWMRGRGSCGTRPRERGGEAFWLTDGALTRTGRCARFTAVPKESEA
jgi:hypothetical protein